MSEWPHPKPLSREKFWDARGVDYRFCNPHGQERYSKAVTGRKPSEDYSPRERMNNGEGLAEVDLTMKKGRPL